MLKLCFPQQGVSRDEAEQLVKEAVAPAMPQATK